MIQAVDVDRAKPWADGPDRQKDEAVSAGSDGRGVGKGPAPLMPKLGGEAVPGRLISGK